jgi:hypothetical protein|tara:strand:- start:435 stop:887 length:453 start_codon:yes stop_codon:yes gene_type:complete
MNGKSFRAARKYGYRSGLEVTLATYLKEKGVDAEYESMKIEWEDLTYRTYTPDFVLPNGIIIEAKGLFTANDRRKHLAIKKQHPNLDIRFVFENGRRKLSKGAKSSYVVWCDRYDFDCYDRIVPEAWLKEKGKALGIKFVAYPHPKIVRK